MRWRAFRACSRAESAEDACLSNMLVQEPLDHGLLLYIREVNDRLNCRKRDGWYGTQFRGSYLSIAMLWSLVRMPRFLG